MLRLALGCACLVACGGVEPADDGGPTDATTKLDSTFGFDTSADAMDAADADGAPPSGTCPPSAPTPGSSCGGGDGLYCEYGSSWALDCNAGFVCEGDHTWHATQQTPCGDASACPPSYPFDAGCSSYASCDYPEAHCVCVVSCGGPPPPDNTYGWVCKAAPANCPWPRPDLGTPCSNEGQLCSYDVGCCGGEELTCAGGLWRGTPGPVCE